MTDVLEDVISRLLVGGSRAIQQVRRDILRFGPTKLPILIQGPTGSGKELVARAIHAMSARTGALVALNVCAVHEGMFEDTLFGHVKGAFTGANQHAAGYLAEANGGTLFLDEISGLAIQAQAKLLRAFETGIYRPVGAGRDRMSDFRLVSASNEDLSLLASERRFREDLLHRIGGCVIRMPPLGQRRDDIPILALHFLAELTGGPAAISSEALIRLEGYSWSGNVRQLRHAMERALVLAHGDEITIAHIERAADFGHAGIHEDVESFDSRLLVVLDRYQWDTVAVAEALNVHRATIYRWMKRLRMPGPRSIRRGYSLNRSTRGQPELEVAVPVTAMEPGPRHSIVQRDHRE